MSEQNNAYIPEPEGYKLIRYGHPCKGDQIQINDMPTGDLVMKTATGDEIHQYPIFEKIEVEKPEFKLFNIYLNGNGPVQVKTDDGYNLAQTGMCLAGGYIIVGFTDVVPGVWNINAYQIKLTLFNKNARPYKYAIGRKF